jgi:hypothetical protein
MRRLSAIEAHRASRVVCLAVVGAACSAKHATSADVIPTKELRMCILRTS